MQALVRTLKHEHVPLPNDVPHSNEFRHYVSPLNLFSFLLSGDVSGRSGHFNRHWSHCTDDSFDLAMEYALRLIVWVYRQRH